MKRKQYIKDLHGKTIRELVVSRNTLKKELFQLKMKHASNGIKKTSDIRMTRRNIARLNTVLSFKIKTLYGSSMK